MDSWVRFAVENGVEDLNIDLMYDIEETHWVHSEMVLVSSKKEVYWVPECVYSCSSIRKLRLVGCNFRENYGSPSWNRLESLSIGAFLLDDSTVNRVLSGCPRLEVFELRLLESGEDLNIRSASLKTLRVEKNFYMDDDEDHPSANTVLRICCPNLDKLELSGAMYSECLITDVSSLTDVIVGFCDGVWDKLVEENMLRQILSTIQHVERLTLSSWCVEVFGESKKKHLLSPLQNVKFLKLDACRIELGDMMNLLGIFPNVKMLVIGPLDFRRPTEKYMEFEANLPKSFLLQLKTVEITSSLFFDSSKLRFFELLLKRANMLEKLVIRVKNIDTHQIEHLCEVWEKLQRSFPNAKVIFNPT